jgi:RNA polymerase sigma-70 factor (ECF subfamily)
VDETRLAVRIRELVEHGDLEPARAAFAELVAAQQRRALRIAYHYLRDGAEADEAVQDAFLKAFVHIKSYRDSWPFEVWFTRILINGCLDRRKARARRERWFASAPDPAAEPAPSGGGEGADPEALLLSRERRARLAAAVNRLEGRQRSVFIMCHFGDCTPREVSAITGLNETTVRVHLFRAARKLRVLLGGTP